VDEVAGFDMSAANLYRWHPAYAAGGQAQGGHGPVLGSSRPPGASCAQLALALLRPCPSVAVLSSPWQ
jgi:hypothetical protein